MNDKETSFVSMDSIPDDLFNIKDSDPYKTIELEIPENLYTRLVELCGSDDEYEMSLLINKMIMLELQENHPQHIQETDMTIVHHKRPVVSSEVNEIGGKFYVSLYDDRGWAKTLVADTTEDIQRIRDENQYLEYTTNSELSSDYDDMDVDSSIASEHHGQHKHDNGKL